MRRSLWRTITPTAKRRVAIIPTAWALTAAETWPLCFPSWICVDKSAYPLCSGGLKTAPESTRICALTPNPCKEYHHRGKCSHIAYSEENPWFSTLITAYFYSFVWHPCRQIWKAKFPVWGIPRTEYDALIESAYFPVHEVMGLSPISLDPFLNGVPCSQFRGTRFRATWLPNRQIFHGFHLPCREEAKSISIKTKSGCLRPFPRTSALAFHCHSIIISA